MWEVEKIENCLMELLNCPLEDGTEILERFRTLPDAIFRQGEKPLERFVYCPGSRKDRVLLIAHCDTVWDRDYGKAPQPQSLVLDGDLVRSGCPTQGIGADDRAGCAMLWALRDSGHSLLVLDGEEHGHFGAKYLCSAYPKLLKELNAHAYMLQLDLWGGRRCMYHGIANSRRFCRQIAAWGFQEERMPNGTDISYLCTTACGANLSVGYRGFHTPKETLSVSCWEAVLHRLREELQKPQKRYRTRTAVRLYRRLRAFAAKQYHKHRR